MRLDAVHADVDQIVAGCSQADGLCDCWCARLRMEAYIAVLKSRPERRNTDGKHKTAAAAGTTSSRFLNDANSGGGGTGRQNV